MWFLFYVLDFYVLLCTMHKLSMGELNRKSVSEFKVADKLPIAVVLDNVRSMHNVGSLFRTADAFLLSGIYLCGYTPKPPHRDIQKTALGATETVAWTYYESCVDAINFLKVAGYKIVAVEQTGKSVLLNKFSFDENYRLAVIFGNEVRGVDEEVLELCDVCIEIPQIGMKHSLNIAVAAGIVLWELVRKRI
jgi:23S rRNA (guanosine2251-2'-O)-methyltransferase